MTDYQGFSEQPASPGISKETLNGVSEKIINGISEKIDNGFNETSKKLGDGFNAVSKGINDGFKDVSKGFGDDINRASERIINRVTENIIDKVVKKPNHLGRLFVLLLIVAVAFLGYQLYQKQGHPTTQADSQELEDLQKSASQTLEALQNLAVKMGATNSGNALDLISAIQIKLDSAQTSDYSTLDTGEIEILDTLLSVKDQATLDKIKKQDAFIKECSGAKVLILKK